MTEKLIAQQREFVRSAVEEFSLQARSATEEIFSSVSSELRRGLVSENGRIVQSHSNAMMIREIDRTYARAVSDSSFHATAAEFVQALSAQVDNFKEMYEEMAVAVPALPEFELDEDQIDLLGVRAAVAVAAVDSITLRVVSKLRQCQIFALGEFPLDDAISYVESVIKGTAQVDGLARDLGNSFFRAVASLTYRKLEASGKKLLYKYAGARNPRNRKFCAKLLDAGQAYTEEEIDNLLNGESLGALDNAGGPGCGHFWEIVGVL